MSEEKFEVIGELELDADGNVVKLEKSWLRQGYVYKNPNTYFNELDAVCYVPELSDRLYTRQDFLNMCNGQTDIADHIFDAVDWQHPETYLDEQWTNEELAECKCGKWFWCYGKKNCPYCGAKYSEEDSE